MATRPLTIVSLMKNIPLDADYNHTLYFANRDAQTAWFGMQDRKNFNPQTYQRVGTNQIRVNAPMVDLYEYNYLMFNNGNNVVLPEHENRYENKWFYAFISNVEYVNDNCALITYEIDVMQTFMFDYTLCDCFVEREHSETDGIGEHIEPEPVAVGEYVYNDRYEGESGEGRYRKLLDCSDLKTVLLYLPPQPTDPQEYLITPMYDGVLNECYMAVFNNLGFFTALGASFAALLGLATPSFVWAEIAERITLSKEYRPIVESVFDFLRVIVPGLIGGVAMSLCRPEIVGDLTSPWQLGVSAFLCLFTIIGMSVFRFNPIFLILLSGVAGMLLL